MSNRYAPLPNPRSDRTQVNGEMEAAFDYSDDEDDDHNHSESQPLNPTNTSISNARVQSAPQPPSPGTYDFENVDYDYPPPGSPPAPSAVALPNSHGNSNGLVPTFETQRQPPRNRQWLAPVVRTVLPSQLAERLGFGQPNLSRVIGGGTNNDGVFANVTAKPSRSVTVQDGGFGYILRFEHRLIASQVTTPSLSQKPPGQRPLRRMLRHKQMQYRLIGRPQSMLPSLRTQ